MDRVDLQPFAESGSGTLSAATVATATVVGQDLESKIQRRKNRSAMTRFSLKCVDKIAGDRGSATDGVQAKAVIMALMGKNQEVNYAIIREKVSMCNNTPEEVKQRILFILGTCDSYTVEQK